jgi:nitroreductase
MIHDLIIRRKSTVLFSSTPIPSEDIEKLFEAARWAPSSNNQQPWRFIYAQQGDAFYDTLLACLTLKNQEWAKKAPLLLITIAQTISDYKDRPNPYAWHDTGMAYANLVLQATSLGLSAHPMGGFDREKTIRLLQIPDRYEPVIFAAIGQKSTKENSFDTRLVEKENKQRLRKALAEIVFHGKFSMDSGLHRHLSDDET